MCSCKRGILLESPVEAGLDHCSVLQVQNTGDTGTAFVCSESQWHFGHLSGPEESLSRIYPKATSVHVSSQKGERRKLRTTITEAQAFDERCQLNRRHTLPLVQ